MRMIVLTAALSLVAPFTPLSAQTQSEMGTPAARDALSRAWGKVLQANGEEAAVILAGIPDGELSEKGANIRACAIERLSKDPSEIAGLSLPADLTLAKVVTRFRKYWREAAMKPAERDAAAGGLIGDIKVILGMPGATNEQVMAEFAKRTAAAGAWANPGRMGYLLNLFYWTEDESRDEISILPERLQSVRVHYLGGFISEGWTNYLTCYASGTGGWAKTDGLYVVVPAYDSLTDEAFRISYLVHESQHFADYTSFPALESWELEYRAKLAELVYLNTTREKVLRGFTANQASDPAEPHSFANRRVLADLRSYLGLSAEGDLAKVEIGQFQYAAASLLRADSARRDRGTDAAAAES